jgi:hypothetical protein
MTLFCVDLIAFQKDGMEVNGRLDQPEYIALIVFCCFETGSAI